MIYILGDSHAHTNFANLRLPHRNFYRNAVTMHRVGRDKKIIGLNHVRQRPEDIYVFCNGEIDCRCHVARQVKLGRDKEEIITTLVNDYVEAIRRNMRRYRAIIVCCVTPPMCQAKYEAQHGPITHEFPFVGSDQERADYTQVINRALAAACQRLGFVFMDYFNHYAEESGMLRYELSDQICHIQKNERILDMLQQLAEAMSLRTGEGQADRAPLGGRWLRWSKLKRILSQKLSQLRVALHELYKRLWIP